MSCDTDYTSALHRQQPFYNYWRISLENVVGTRLQSSFPSLYLQFTLTFSDITVTVLRPTLLRLVLGPDSLHDLISWDFDLTFCTSCPEHILMQVAYIQASLCRGFFNFDLEIGALAHCEPEYCISFLLIQASLQLSPRICRPPALPTTDLLTLSLRTEFSFALLLRISTVPDQSPQILA